VKEYPDALKGHPDAFIFQLQNDEQNAGKLFKINSNYHHSMETYGKTSPNESRNNAITNKRIETQESKDLTQLKL